MVRPSWSTASRVLSTQASAFARILRGASRLGPDGPLRARAPFWTPPVMLLPTVNTYRSSQQFKRHSTPCRRPVNSKAMTHQQMGSLKSRISWPSIQSVCTETYRQRSIRPSYGLFIRKILRVSIIQDVSFINAQVMEDSSHRKRTHAGMSVT